MEWAWEDNHVGAAVGVYVSVPFCRAKCTFCNFASDAFPAVRMQAYVERVLRELAEAENVARRLGCLIPAAADSLYLGGGTPSLLAPAQLRALLDAARQRFVLTDDAEMTMEAAPGQISDALLAAGLEAGVNRVSLGVQSFVDREARAVGRLHTGAGCVAEIARLQQAGTPRLSVDLIAGLPHQGELSWAESLQRAIDSGVEHVSVYMLETDGESRLGTEVERLRTASQLSVLGQEARYHAEAVPADELCADLYAQACETLDSAGLQQYEISNFARPGAESRHNLKYWRRVGYLGLGLDAHSMLHDERGRAIRFQNADDLDRYMASDGPTETLRVGDEAAFEEAVFLGLRMTDGVAVGELAAMRQPGLLQGLLARAHELASEGLLTEQNGRIALTARGRVLSSAVFGELLTVAA